MFEHKSVMLHEAVDALQVKKDGIYVDCTLGGGGHSSQILSQLESGHLYCFDQDQHAIDAASERLSKISDHFTIIHSNFKNIKSELEKRGVYKVDGVLFDLGVLGGETLHDQGLFYGCFGNIGFLFKIDRYINIFIKLGINFEKYK